MNHIIDDNKKKCCGCNNCCNICPTKAITMIEDNEGFFYPHIDKNKCINCGACKKVCPWINDIKRNEYFEEPECFAAKIKDKKIQKQSTSGGMFYALASNVIDRGGLVVGSEMDLNHKVHHKIIEQKSDLHRIMGSKYVYSELNDIFNTVKNHLIKGKLVLFSGVPCQVSALLNYLKKPFDNLITVEVICHGTPPQKLFDKYVDFLEKKHKAKLIQYSFRSKKAAKWGTFKAFALFEKNTHGKKEKTYKYINADFDPYYWSFLNAKNYRECCYECKFASKERFADITLGDCWGIEQIKPEMIDYEGVSVAIINTLKGKTLFNNTIEKIECSKVSFDLIQNNNEQLKCPSIRNADRETWYNNFNQEDFINNIQIKKNIKSYIKLVCPQKLKFVTKIITSKIKNKGDKYEKIKK